MARRQSDREDLLREATALVERIELQGPASAEPVTAGFRAGGGASFFFGADPVYQFNTQRQLRRAYQGARLLKAERGKLIALTRRRSEGEVALLRRELDAAATREFIEEMADHFTALRAMLQSGEVKVVGQVPEEADVLGCVHQWLDEMPSPIEIADAPNVR